MLKIQDAEIRNMKDGDNKVVSLGTSNGAIVFRKVGNNCTAYYRYWQGKKSVLIKLGVYRQTPKSPGMKLSALTDKALEMVSLRKQVAPIGLKEYLKEQEGIRIHEEKERRRLKAEEAKKGTLHDLMECYAGSLIDKHKKRNTEQTFDVLAHFNTFVIKPYPELASKHAGDISSEDLMPLMSGLVNRDKPGMYNQLRAYLSACFNFGIRADYDPRLNSNNGKRFNIRFNPVTPFHKEAWKARHRELSHEELRMLWRDIDRGIFAISQQYGLFIKFCFACFGNRPLQLARVRWKDIDFKDRTLSFMDYKGKGEPKITVIPLTDMAMDILRQLPLTLDYPSLSNDYRTLEDSKQPVFTTKNGTPLNYYVLERKVREHNQAIQLFNIRKAEADGVEYEAKERWTIKDIRRTAVSIMTRARIIREHRYLLQSRSDGSIEARHYDVSDRMDEKREAALKYEAILNTILQDVEGMQPKKPLMDTYEGFVGMIREVGELSSQKQYIREGYCRSDVKHWFNRMLSDGIIEMYGRIYVMKGFVDKNEQRLMKKHLKDKRYREFRQKIENSGELLTQEAYRVEGYSTLLIRRWFRLLKAEGVIVRQGRGHKFIHSNGGTDAQAQA